LQRPTRTDFQILLKLAIPLILTGAIEASIGFFSTFFLARLGKQTLAAGGLVGWFFATLMVVLWGTLTAVSVLVSRKHGEKNNKAISLVLRDSLILISLIVIPIFFLLRHMAPIFGWAGQGQDIVHLAKAYLNGLAWGVLPDFVGLVLTQFLIGLGHTRTSMFFTLIWVPINIISNYALVFGKFGLPALGIAGIGWGMTFSYWVAAIGLIIYIVSRAEYRCYFPEMFKFSRLQYLKEILYIGLPMGGMFCLEIGFFFVVALVMAHFGSQVLAANQIIMQYLGMLTSVTFSIAGAITVRMGHMLGAKEPAAAERAAMAGVWIAVLYTAVIAVCCWLLPNYLISLDFDINNPNNAMVVKLAREFFAVCAFFQLFEAVRIPLYGALRALKDTHFTFITSCISFWLIPLPIGYLLGFVLNWQGVGVWCGMALGALAGAFILGQRFTYKMKQCYAL
jgi:MATE family multidrug resistance protein